MQRYNIDGYIQRYSLVFTPSATLVPLPGGQCRRFYRMNTFDIVANTLPLAGGVPEGGRGAIEKSLVTTKLFALIKNRGTLLSSSILFSDSLGARTQDPILKRDVLYLLS